MITYNNKNYENFAQFAKAYQNRYKKADFSKVDYSLTLSEISLDNLNKSDICREGVYEINGCCRFFITAPFKGNYKEISENGNVKNCNDSLQIIYLQEAGKNGERAVKGNDICQIRSKIRTLLGWKSGVAKTQKKSKKIDEEVISAKFADFAEFCKSLHIPFNHIGLLDMALYEYRKGIKETELAEKMARYKKAGLSDAEIELLTKLA